MADAHIRAVITAEDRASGTLSAFGKKAITLGKIIGGAYVAKKVIDFGVSSVKAFDESQQALAQLNTVLKSTKSVAGITSKAAIDLAKSLQKVTKYSDEETLSAESLLLTFTKINKDIFPQTVRIVQDMSTALGQDLKSSSIQVGKALQDPIKGVTALRRVGVNFNQAQTDVIKKLVETGHQAQAQALILKELQTEFGGSAVAAGKTFGGQLAILKNRFNDVQEKIGEFIVNTIPPLINAFKLAWAFLVKTFGPAISQLYHTFADQLIPSLKRLRDSLEPGLSKALKVIAGILAITLIVALKLSISWFNTIVNAISRVIDAIASVIRWFRRIAGAVKTAFSGVYGAITGPFVRAFSYVKKVYDYTIAPIIKALNAVSHIKFSEGQRTLNKNPIIPGGKIPGNAGGTDYWRGGTTWVGEKGPELLNLPRGSQITPNNKAMGSSVHFNVNIGMFAGTQMERRKIAKILFRDFQDAASQLGIRPSDLLDKTHGARII